MEYFEKIYIINLPERLDRRNEIDKQLNNINLSLNSANIQLFPGLRPKEAGEFETAGTRGCFLSHLAVLKDASENQYQRILILEDDVNFIKEFKACAIKAFYTLRKVEWNIFYAGHDIDVGNKNPPRHCKKFRRLTSYPLLTVLHYKVMSFIKHSKS